MKILKQFKKIKWFEDAMPAISRYCTGRSCSECIYSKGGRRCCAVSNMLSMLLRVSPEYMRLPTDWRCRKLLEDETVEVEPFEKLSLRPIRNIKELREMVVDKYFLTTEN